MSTEDSKSSLSSLDESDDDWEEKKQIKSAIQEEDSSDQLISKMKNLTTLIDLDHADWSLKTDEAIEMFLMKRHENVLTIFYDEDKLVAVCGYPSLDLSDLMYFLKNSTDVDITEENFHRVVSFGTTNTLAEGTLLTLLEQIYSPIFNNIKNWPDSVKQEFITTLWRVTSTLCSIRYKTAGLSVLSIPPLALSLTPTAAARNNQFIKMLESIVSEWTNEIQEALRDLDEASPQHLLVPLDILNFWKYRYENLRGFTFQLNNKHLKHIISILYVVQSSYVSNFQSVIEDINKAIKIAESNVTFLQILEEPCTALLKISSPMEVIPFIPKILHSFKVIWHYSPFYNSDEKMSQMCQSLSNQVIILCTNLMDLSIVFEGQTRTSMQIFEQCIKCCYAYKSIYDKLILVYNSTSEKKWNLDLKLILNSVDTFIERCQEMVEICETMLIYGRLDETKDVPKPSFGLTRGTEFEKTCEKIEDLFHESFSKIEKVQDSILDVKSSDWYGEMNRVRQEIKIIDTFAENLILDCFNMVKNVEEGLDSLQSFHEYSKRPSLTGLLEKKTAFVYKMFWDELKDAKMNLIAEKNQCPVLKPKFAGRAWIALTMKTRLKSLHNLFQERRWLLSVAIARETEVLYQDVMATIDKTICNYYKKWLRSVGTNIFSRLKRPLISRCLEKPGLLEVNIDRKLLYIIKETKLWTNMNFSVPNELNNLLARNNEFMLLYRNVETVVMDYNRIVASLSDSERVLFRVLIKSKEKFISACWRKLSWASDDANSYIISCINELKELQDFIDDYKKYNVEIVKICEKICITNMIHIEAQEHSLSDLKMELQKYKFKSMSLLIKYYNKIFRYLSAVFSGFKNHTKSMAQHFINYVDKIDNVLLEAFRLCIKNSLQRMLNYLEGDQIKGPNPFIFLSLTLTNSIIEFSPTLVEVFSFVRNIFFDLLLTIKIIPRLLEKFHFICKLEPQSYAALIAGDRECTLIQSRIEKQIVAFLSDAKAFVRKWTPLCDIWELNKDTVMKHYEEGNPSADIFDADINKYLLFIEMMDTVDNVTVIRFVKIESSQLTKKIIEHCKDWQSRLIKLLIELTTSLIDKTYEYAQKNAKKITTKPETLNEILESFQLHKLLLSQIESVKVRFKTIEDYLTVYKKFMEDIPERVVAKKNRMELMWRDYETILEELEAVLIDTRENYRNSLQEKCVTFKKNLQGYLDDFLASAPFTSDWNADVAIKHLKTVRSELLKNYDYEAELRKNLSVFNLTLPVSVELENLDQELSALESVWALTLKWETCWEEWKKEIFLNIDVSAINSVTDDLLHQLNMLLKQLSGKKWEVLETTKNRVDLFKKLIPLLLNLKNPSLKKRHWEEIRKETYLEFDERSDSFTLEFIVTSGMQASAEFIHEVSKAASIELSIENNLESLKKTWDALSLETSLVKNKGYYILKSTEEIEQTLNDNLIMLNSMKRTKYIQPFVEVVNNWDSSLIFIDKILEMILIIQKRFLQLESIFLNDEVHKMLPVDFDCVIQEWINITSLISKIPCVLHLAQLPGLESNLSEISSQLESIHYELEQFVSTKRSIFPRFYFLSDNDLLTIICHNKSPEYIQPIIQKCFSNISELKMTKNIVIPTRTDVFGWSADDGESIDFSSIVVCEGPVEKWLSSIEFAIKSTLRDQIKRLQIILKKKSSRKCKWIKDWPGQVAIVARQIQSTEECATFLVHSKLLSNKKLLKKLRKKQATILEHCVEIVQSSLTKLQRLKYVAMMVVELLIRDVIDKLCNTVQVDISAFEWQSQFRFYWDSNTDDCIVRQNDFQLNYGNEYLGNSSRAAHTPLTERCYLALTTAMHFYQGGMLTGPTGAGKTEIIQNFGKICGYWVMLSKCSENLSLKSVHQFLSGLAQQGAWGCFDEFNKLNAEVVSVVTQKLNAVFNALSQACSTLLLNSDSINIRPTFNLFITINLSHHRFNESFNSVKLMFRPVSVIVPDLYRIAEVKLFSEGFFDAPSSANKICNFITLCKTLLSKSVHLDTGLRNVINLIRYSVKQRKIHKSLNDDEILKVAMERLIVSSLHSKDLSLLKYIINYLFPGTHLQFNDRKKISDSIEEEYGSLKLSLTSSLKDKVLQLYDLKFSRNSVIILGQAGVGKSTARKVLKNSIEKLNDENSEKIEEHVINPKVMSFDELYGYLNTSSQQWVDGLLPHILRKASKEKNAGEKWIVFDAPIDGSWVENLDFALDQSNKLFLSNNEQIQLSDSVSFFFEVDCLRAVSPTIISRCGVVLIGSEDFHWSAYVKSWLESVPNKLYVQHMKEHFEHYLMMVLKFKKQNCPNTLEASELHSVISLCTLLNVLTMNQESGIFISEMGDSDEFAILTKLWFLFCLTWSVCANVNAEGRRKIDSFIRELENCFPAKDSIYEYFVDPKNKCFVHWEDKLPENWHVKIDLPFYQIIIPTISSLRYEFLIQHLISHVHPVLLAGPVGSGKTLLATNLLKIIDPLLFNSSKMNFTIETTSDFIRNSLQSHLERRMNGFYFPSNGKTMISFLDDFNMPAYNTSENQSALEFVRQWIEYGFWYDGQTYSRKFMKNVVPLAAMRHSGFSQISNRILRRFYVFHLTELNNDELTYIFSSLFSSHFAEFDESVRSLSEDLVSMSIDIFNDVKVKMLPVPKKSLYLFNIRDILNVFQGLLRSNKQYQDARIPILKLWVHENLRVFNDRFVDEEDSNWFMSQINDKLGKYFGTSFPNICPKIPIFSDLTNENHLYEDVSDITFWKNFISQKLDGKDSSTVRQLDLILFDAILETIACLVRVISQPKGNVLLIGPIGSGRRSLAFLSAQLCNFKTFSINIINNNYSLLTFKNDLKHLFQLVVIENQPVVFILWDSQILHNSFLSIINDILKTGGQEYFTVDCKLENVFLMEEKNNAPVSSAFFSDRVQKNLHLVFCTNPLTNNFHKQLHEFPSLVDLMSSVLIKEWSPKVLMNIADNFFKDLDLMKKNEALSDRRESFVEGTDCFDMKPAICNILALVHISVEKCSSKMKSETGLVNYIAPHHFFKFLKGYKKMIVSQKEKLQKLDFRLRNALQKIEETENEIQNIKVKLKENTVTLNKLQQECNKSLASITYQEEDIENQEKSIKLKKEKLEEEKEECAKMAQAALENLAIAIPSVESAIKALRTISEDDLEDLRSFKRPPKPIEMVLEAITVLLKVEPTWNEAQYLMSDKNFLNNLCDFDKDNISEDVLKMVDTCTCDPEFDPQKIDQVSKSCGILANWVLAIEYYGKRYRIFAPKKAKIDAAVILSHEKEADLFDAITEMNRSKAALEELKKEYEEKLKETAKFSEDVRGMESIIDQTIAIIDGLLPEKTKWKEAVNLLNSRLSFVLGDSLVGSAVITYFGPFTKKFRSELLAVIIEELKKRQIPLSPNFDIINFFNESFPSSHLDSVEKTSAIIMFNATSWPLIIDSENQAVSLIEKTYKTQPCSLLYWSEKNCAEKLKTAVIQGHLCIVLNVTEETNFSITSFLDSHVINEDKHMTVKVGNEEVTFNENFKLFLLTCLARPNFSSDILARTTFINFELQKEGLEMILLNKFIQKENKDLEETRDSLILNIREGEKSLSNLEDNLITRLNDSKTTLLENPELFDVLKFSKSLLSTVKDQLNNNLLAKTETDSTRDNYRSFAREAVSLYFAMTDLRFIDPLYQFSLNFYIDVFHHSIEKCKRHDSLSKRLENLKKFHALSVFRFICQGISHSHKLLFAFLMSSRVLRESGGISEDEYSLFLAGAIEIEQITPPQTSNLEWLPTNLWTKLLKMNDLHCLNGICKSFQDFPFEWKNWYFNEKPESLPLISEYETKCSPFQRLMIICCLRIDRLMAGMSKFIEHTIGPKFLKFEELNIKLIFEESNFATPIMFLPSSGVDPVEKIQEFSKQVAMSDRLQILFVEDEKISYSSNRIIEDAKEKGFWMILLICNRLNHRLKEAEQLINNLKTNTSHNDFRLWITVQTNKNLDSTIPVPLLQNSLKIVHEPPRGLSATVKHLLRIISQSELSTHLNHALFKNLVLSLCFFHSVLIERSQFGALGWKIPYNFSDEDFILCIKTLSSFFNGSISLDRFKHNLTNSIYGGHILNEFDFHTLSAYVNLYFRDCIEQPNEWLLTAPFSPLIGGTISELFEDSAVMFSDHDALCAFHQHFNAAVEPSTAGSLAVLRSLWSIDYGIIPPVESSEGKELTLVKDILSGLPPYLAEETNGTDPIINNLLTEVIMKEINVYNKLLENVLTSLSEVENYTKGLWPASAEIIKNYRALSRNEVPKLWAAAYSSLKPLSSWLKDFKARLEFFRSLKTLDSLTHFRLSYFVDPKRFLTSVQQVYSQKHSKLLHSIGWEFIPQPCDRSQEVAEDGVLISGMYLKGAGWDEDRMCLCEPTPLKLLSQLPVFLFKPTDVLKSESKNTYACPVYYTSGSADFAASTDFIIAVDLKSEDESPDHWALYGTCIILNFDL